MTDVQMIQTKGQTMSGADKKTADSSQNAFLDMMLEISRSGSETEKTDTEETISQNGIRESNKETDGKVEDKELDKTELTDKVGDNDDSSDIMMDVPVGEEMVLLAGLAASLSENVQNIEQQPATGESQPVISEEIPEIAAAEETQAENGGNISEIPGTDESQMLISEEIPEIAAADESQTADSTETVKIAADNAIEQPGQLTEPEKGSIAVSPDRKAMTDDKEKKGSNPGTTSAEMLTERSLASTVSTVPVEGGETGTLTVKTSSETLVTDVSEAIVSRMPFREGTSTLELTLEPANLGRITIRMVYEDGGATISLISGNAKTLEILSRNVSEIAQILQDKTGMDTVVYVPEGQQAEENNNWTQREGRQQQEQREQPEKKDSDSFMQQLRLGLI